LSDYLTSYNAGLIYQTKADMSNYYNKTAIDNNYYTKNQTDTLFTQSISAINGSLLSDYLTSYNAGLIYQTKADMSNYYNKTAIDNNYYRKTAVNANFQSILSMNEYYTKNNCDARFQTITTMGEYYEKSDSDAKFQTITGMSNYYIKSQIDDKFQPYVTQAGLMLLLSAYPTFGYSNANYQLKSDMINYFTALQITSNYYDKGTVDNYINAKIDETYVLEMMYNELGHQYFIAVDPETSTTDAQFIINNDQKHHS
jgi:hypothetical protein